LLIIFIWTPLVRSDGNKRMKTDRPTHV